MLQIRALGSFDVHVGGAPLPVDAWPRRKTKDLLKVLLTAPGETLTVDQLIGALWPDSSPTSAARNAQARVSELRHVLEPGLKRGSHSKYIKHVGEGYALVLGADLWLDSEAFRTLLVKAHDLADRSKWVDAAEASEEAATLYRGEFLTEDRYAEWAEPTRRELRELHLEALSRLAACYAKLGRLRQAISCCQRILALEPCREDVIRRLMTYQAEAGQRAQALETFQETCQALREHLDVEPSAETQSLFAELSAAPDANQTPLDPRRIAVLPFASYSSHPEDEYFADGMTEELIASLSKIKDFRVVARTSMERYRETTKPITAISRELGVGTILEGSVRKAGGKVRITAQLIDGSTEDHLWAEHYDLDVGDVLEIQAEIARRASEALKIELLTDEVSALQAAEARDPEAHIAYLKGRYYLKKYTKEALETAMGYFEEALRKDPAYARALTGLADAWLRMEAFTSSEESYRRAKAYAKQALALDDSLPEVYTSLAFVVEGYESDLAEAERLLRRAIQLDPSYALAHARLATILGIAKRLNEGLEALRTALSLDPLSPHLIAQYAHWLMFLQRYVEAVDQARRALELDEENDSAWWTIWFSHAALWDWKRGEVILREMVEKYPENPLALVFLSVSVQTNGRVEEGVRILEKALSLPGARERMWVLHQGAVNFMMAQQYDRALDLADEGVERWPTSNDFRLTRVGCYLMQGRLDDCLEELAVMEGLLHWDAYIPRMRCRVYAARGEIEKAEEELKKLIEHTEYSNRRICTAYALAGLGRIEEAIDWFEGAADAHEIHIATVRNLPTAPRELREHPRFQAFLKRVGLGDDP